MPFDPFAPPTQAATRPTGDDLAAMVLDWAQSADAVDDVELMEVLARTSGAAPERTASLRANAAYLRRDPEATLRALAEIGAHEVAPEGPQSMDGVLALGARSCRGDVAAFSALVAVGPHVPPALRVRFLYVLAIAAESVGQAGMADEAWRSVVVDHGVRTTFTMSRAAAGSVAGRSRTNAPEAVGTVMGWANALRAMSPRPVQDAATTRLTIDHLLGRGDDAGAALLAAAVRRTSPAAASLDELAARTRPAISMAGRVVPWVCGAAGAVLGMALKSPVALLLGIGAGRLARRFVRLVPSMSETDEKVWSSIEGLRFDERRGATGSSLTEVRAWPTLGLLVGLTVGVLVGIGLDGAVAGREVGTGVHAILWLVPIVGGSVLGLGAGLRLTRHRDASKVRRREADEDVARLAGAQVCRCWESDALVGPFALAYGSAHLGGARVPVSDLLPTGRPGVLLQCPVSGIRWLATTTASHGSDLLLRASAPAPADDAAGAPKGLGGYI
ncbi:hypothetical protein [Cellulomonas sp. PhB150]|uniref:hypothetical protein n=1 Tax=Cellulomonas sp. PhB150 TaxID=2485188 RepID=UPI000F4A0DD8|nr:hypothetical protein [Cellulomonas sp. PhB150]ROS31389.1 hypothetical protein EDF34_1047 [Cellulomonas sp. PhB150]